jgi:hypothetical protein
MHAHGLNRLVVLLSLVAFATPAVVSQTSTTNTNCTTVGANTDCTSTTTNNSTQQQQAYEAGQQIGSALGTGIARAMQAHAFNKGLKKYCDAHPGQDWHYYSRADGHTISSGHCPSFDDKAVATANSFMARHKDYIPGDANSKVMVAYLEEQKLDPREEKSYERAYKELKKSGKLQLYAN